MSLVFAGLIGMLLVLLISLLVGISKYKLSSRSISNFYIAGGTVDEHRLRDLIMASSMSLNGLFYHTWLGYKVGIYSLLVQLFWAGSFLWLIFYRNKLLTFTKEKSLFGAIGSKYGNFTARATALASCLSLIILVGWEASIAGSLAKDLGSLSDQDAFNFALLIVAIASLYTFRGGILANVYANQVQNYLKFVCFVLILAGAVYLLNNDSVFSVAGYQTVDQADRLKLKWQDAAIALFGISALICNLFFSFMWQPADPTTWQNVSASSNTDASESKVLKKSLLLGAGLVFIFPGLAGTLFGMSLASVSGLTDQTIMSSFYVLLNSLDFGWVLVLCLSAMLTAAMLSTTDGLLLGVSYILNREVFGTKKAEKLYQVELDSEEYYPGKSETLRLFFGKALVLLAAGLSLGVFWLVQSGFIGLFEVVYVAVIGQMAVSPFAIALLMSKTNSQRNGRLAIVAGLISGLVLVLFHLFEFNGGMAVTFENAILGGVPWLILAPPLTFLIVCFFLMIASDAPEANLDE